MNFKREALVIKKSVERSEFVVDMHVHTSVSSPCSFIDPERLITRARSIGLDAVCVTDHDGIEGAQIAFELGKKVEYPVFRGMEVYTELGDMLVFGVYDNALSWMTTFDEVIKFCHKNGAIAVPAHISKTKVTLDEEGRKKMDEYVLRRVKALETYNGGSTPEENRHALELARKYSLASIGGSDAHHEFQIGRCVTVFKVSIQSERELIEAVKLGLCRGEYGSFFLNMP